MASRRKKDGGFVSAKTKEVLRHSIVNSIVATVMIGCAVGLDQLEHYLEKIHTSDWLVTGVHWMCMFLFIMDALLVCWIIGVTSVHLACDVYRSAKGGPHDD